MPCRYFFAAGLPAPLDAPPLLRLPAHTYAVRGTCCPYAPCCLPPARCCRLCYYAEIGARSRRFVIADALRISGLAAARYCPRSQIRTPSPRATHAMIDACSRQPCALLCHADAIIAALPRRYAVTMLILLLRYHFCCCCCRLMLPRGAAIIRRCCYAAALRHAAPAATPCCFILPFRC